MSWRILQRRTRLDLLRGILVVGLTTAIAVFLTAGSPAPDPLGDPLHESKAYRRQMEMVGGQANLLASDLAEGFQSLWRGKSLAFTLAFLTLVLAGGFWLVTEDQRPDRPGRS
ncbi:MAG: hypothetical protein ABSH53_13405 [Holophaga sp.]